MREIRYSQRQGTDPGVEARRFLVGELEKILQKTQFVQHIEGRGVDGVPAEVAQKVRVFLQDEDLDAGSGQQEPQHDPRRTAACYAAVYRPFLRSHDLSPVPNNRAATLTGVGTRSPFPGAPDSSG